MTNHIDKPLFELMRMHGYDGDANITLKQCEYFINSINNQLVLRFDYDKQCDSWYFIVHDIKTNHEYQQTVVYGNTLNTAYIDGLKYILKIIE